MKYYEEMEIVLNVGLNVAGKRGIDSYMGNLVEWLAELDARNRYLVFSYFFRNHAMKRARLPHPARPNFEMLAPRWPETVINALERRGLPVVERFLLTGRHPDIYHSLTGILPHLRGPKTVTTIYDLCHERIFRATPEYRPGLFATPDYRATALRADRVIAVSQATKGDLIEIYGVPEGKIEVIETGANLRSHRPVTISGILAATRRRYKLPQRYIVLLGPFEYRRNAEAVIDALAAAEPDSSCALAFVGQGGLYRNELEARARKLGLSKRVVLCGYVADEDMAAVFSGAQAFVHPSRLEGFGTVSLEAMACGCPVLTSNIPSILEAVGDAALTVAPEDTGALTRALRELLANAQLRADLRFRGLERAALFSYEKIAGKVLSLYERLAGK